MAGADASIVIPILSVSLEDGDAIRAQLAQGVTMRLARRAALPRDGSFDNTVVAHKWGHYLSNRLVGNGNSLDAAQGRGMGEGWSDFVAMLLFVKEEGPATSRPTPASTARILTRPIPTADPSSRPTCSTTRTTTACAAIPTRGT